MDGLTLSERFFTTLFWRGKKNRQLKEIEREKHQHERTEIAELNRSSYMSEDVPVVSIGNVLYICFYVFWMTFAVASIILVVGIVFIYAGLDMGKYNAKLVHDINTFYESKLEFIHESISQGKIETNSWLKSDIDKIQIFSGSGTYSLQVVLLKPEEDDAITISTSPIVTLVKKSKRPEVLNVFEKVLERIEKNGIKVSVTE